MAELPHNSLAYAGDQSDSCDRGNHRQGENMTSIEETTQSEATSETPKGTKKANAGKRARNVAPKKGKSGKKATPAKKAPKSAKKVPGAREGSKTTTILERLKRPEGATTKELLKATGWQPHSLRGFISGTLGKKMGLTVESSKSEVGERTYSVKA
jgi:hypothetical protein